MLSDSKLAPDVLKRLKEDQKTYKRRMHRMATGILASVPLLCLLAMLKDLLPLFLFQAGIAVVGLWGTGSYLCLQAYRTGLISHKYQHSIQHVLTTPTYAELGFLIEASVYCWCWKDMQKKAKRAVHQLLAQAEEHNSIPLLPTQQNLLWDMAFQKGTLKAEEDEIFAISMLHALPYFGGEALIPSMRRLLSAAQYTSNSPALTKAVQQCLTRLEFQAEEREQKKMLLRSAGPHQSAISPETLLIPATGTLETQFDQFLKLQSK